MASSAEAEERKHYEKQRKRRTPVARCCFCHVIFPHIIRPISRTRRYMHGVFVDCCCRHCGIIVNLDAIWAVDGCTPSPGCICTVEKCERYHDPIPLLLASHSICCSMSWLRLVDLRTGAMIQYCLCCCRCCLFRACFVRFRAVSSDAGVVEGLDAPESRDGVAASQKGHVHVQGRRKGGQEHAAASCEHALHLLGS